MRYLLVGFFLFGLGSFAFGADMETTVNQMIKERIADTHSRYKEAQKQQADQERVVFPKAAYDAGISFLECLLKSKDTELKRRYLLTLCVPELEWEKGNLEFAEEPAEKKELLAKIKKLNEKIAKLSKP